MFVKCVDEGRAGGDNLADGPGIDVLFGLDDFGPVLGIFGDHKDTGGRPGGVEDAVAGVEGQGDGFF